MNISIIILKVGRFSIGVTHVNDGRNRGKIQIEWTEGMRFSFVSG